MTGQMSWDRRAVVLTAALWAVLFAGAWLLGRGSGSASTPGSPVAINSGVRTAAIPGPALPGLAALPGVPALARSAPAPARRPRRVTKHAVAAPTHAAAPVQSVAVAPPVRRTTIVPVVVAPPAPTTPPRTTTPTPPPPHRNPPPSGTGTVSGGG